MESAGQDRGEQTLDALRNVATWLRINSITATTEAGSGHVTSSCSSADIVATLFFSVMRFDPLHPAAVGSDRFILSKGHAAPLLYAAWCEAGLLSPSDLGSLRSLDSDLEGHPTTRLPFVDVATGSLGQGLSAGAGMAWSEKYLDQTSARIYVLMGDGETSEGSVWEAIEFAARRNLDNLCAIVDVNRLAQSGPTMFGHDLDAHRTRWAAFGWNTIAVDGHDVAALASAFAEAQATSDRPTGIFARTLKGKGLPAVEDQENNHGKPLSRVDARKAVELLQAQLIGSRVRPAIRAPVAVKPNGDSHGQTHALTPCYSFDESVATRDAFGDAVVDLGHADTRIVALDGDVKDLTRLERFAAEFPDRFIECHIAEQNMVGVGTGLAACGKIPFVATFGSFLTRAYDFIRMAAIGGANLKLIGSHVGVSVGQDGPSQMALEDIAMMAAQPNVVVLCPADATSCYRLVVEGAKHPGMVYLRLTRALTPVLYDNNEEFHIGGSKVLRRGDGDQATIVAAGVTLFEALDAHDQLKCMGISTRVIDLYSIKPLDEKTLIECVRETDGHVFTVEDHYEHGGLGDAVATALAMQRARVHKLAVHGVSHSGRPDELMEYHGIDSRGIVETVRRALKSNGH